RIKAPLRETLNVLAGGLQQLASEKATEVLLGSIIGAGGLPGLFATLLAKPLIDGLINSIIGATLNSIRAFPTGVIATQPTLALIGDGNRLGGENEEYVLKQPQVVALLAEHS